MWLYNVLWYGVVRDYEAISYQFTPNFFTSHKHSQTSETRMWGADDPDCRKPLWWNEFTFQPETRNNIQQGAALYDSVGFNQQWFNFYKMLIAIRNSHPVLATGNIDFIDATGKTLVYKRYDKDATIFVLFNLESSTKTFTLPEKGIYFNLLDGQSVTGNAISLAPLSAAILSQVK